jgi:hypothetical protein
MRPACVRSTPDRGEALRQCHSSDRRFCRNRPTAGMATDEFVRECLRGLSDDVYTNAIGMAAKFYAEREQMLPVLNPP